MIIQNIFHRVRTPKKLLLASIIIIVIITIITIIIINPVWIYPRFGANQFPFSENEKEMLRRP